VAEGGRERGGILALLDLIEERQGPLEYDFRARFHIGLDSVPDVVGWGEAIRLVKVLRADPSSMVAAAAEGWDYPLSRTEAILMDLYDLEYAKTGAKNRKPYPRPYKPVEAQSKRGDSGGRSGAEILALLRPETA
jgi:hypothetical protein